MHSRRTLAKRGLAGMLAVGTSQLRVAGTQAFEPDIDVQGLIAVSNLPELPTAPDGECAIVLQATSDRNESVAVVYHNNSDEVLCVNSVTATYTPPEGRRNVIFDPDATVFAPHTLQPGEYGMSCPAFGWYLDPEGEVEVELEVVPESERDTTLVNLVVPAIGVSPAEGNQSPAVSATVVNFSGRKLAKGSGLAGIFFTPDGKILGWFTRTNEFDFDAGDRRYFGFGNTSLQVSDSFMVAYSGRAID